MYPLIALQLALNYAQRNSINDLNECGMETIITINVVEWVLRLAIIWLTLSLANTILALYKRYLEWKIKKT